MSDRDVIAAHERVHGLRLATCLCGWEEPIRGRDVTALHAAHVVAALRESRTVRTQEEAMALPAGSIIIDAENNTMKHYGGDHWCEPGNSGRWNARDFEYPVRVLYRPDEDGAPLPLTEERIRRAAEAAATGDADDAQLDLFDAEVGA